MSNLHLVTPLVEEAMDELTGLRHQRDKATQEIHQLKQRLRREQERSQDLEDRFAALELRAADAEQRASRAEQATLAHAARTA